MKRHYYALITDQYSFDQTRECRKEWGTVQVKVFDNEADRDDFCNGTPYRFPISYNDAKYYGIPDPDVLQ